MLNFTKLKFSAGITLIEIIISILILSVVMLAVMGVFIPSLGTSLQTFETTRSQQLVQSKINQIHSVGFWLDNVDTASPLYPSSNRDLAILWKSDFDQINLGHRGTISVQFLKEVNGIIQPFATHPFDGNYPRNKINVTVEILIEGKGKISESIQLFLSESGQSVQALLWWIKHALEMYYDNNGSYPVSLSNLVPLYLKEIPNDPYSIEHEKITHCEEINDWSYHHDSQNRTVTIFVNSNISHQLSWSY